MTMNPNYLTSPILPGYAYQGEFYPVDSSVQLGYWYNNAFYGSEWIEAGYDFTQTIDAYPYGYSQTGYQQLPSGSVPGYTYHWDFFKTYKEASAYQQQLYQQYQYQMYISSTLPAQDVPKPATIQSGPGVKVAAQKPKKCFLCSQDQPIFMDVLGKACCMHCLKTRYLNNELYFGTEPNKLLWTDQIVYDVHTNLRNRLPQGERDDLPSEIKLPLESTICIGRKQEVADGYPSTGHIIGVDRIYVGKEGCINPDHVLCKYCALMLLYCPICNAKIMYEEFPHYPPDCPQNHVYSFDEPCPTCKQKAKRTKHEEAKVEEKQM